MSKNKAISTQKIDDVNVAAMLFTLGFSQERKAIQIKKRNGKIQFIYFFKGQSDDGKYNLKECLSNWEEDNFIVENPTHEQSAIKLFNSWRNQLLSEIKADKGMLTEVEADGVEALINLNAPAENLQEFLG